MCEYCNAIYYVEVKQLMTPMLAPLTHTEEIRQEFCIDICEEKECNIEKCKERIKQYFENKVKELLNK